MKRPVIRECPSEAPAVIAGVHFADAAMEGDAGARDAVPQGDLLAWEAIQEAFEHYEAGRDDAARESLKSIGLMSPFLEWKLLLRGLIAFTAGDDERALENWSRLSSNRRPARWIAPLRWAIDSAFRAGQSAEIRLVLQRQSDRLHGVIVSRLRTVQSCLDRGQWAKALRDANSVIAAMEHDWPDAADRVGRCLRSKLLTVTVSREFDRLCNLVSAGSDDPHRSRFLALAAEHARDYGRANRHWANLESTIAVDSGWSAQDRPRAQAILWCRMAHNAVSASAEGETIQPSAETCFQRAAKLDPEMLEPLEQLFRLYRQLGRIGHAIAIGKRLLKSFPDHAPTLDELADLCQHEGDFQSAYTFAERALAANPLSQQCRRRFSILRRCRARALAGQGKWLEAQGELSSACQLSDDWATPCVHALACAIAFRSGDTEAANASARAATSVCAAAGYLALSAEASRFKLPRTIKSEYDRQFIQAASNLKGARTASAIAGAFQSLIAHGTYSGAKGHEKRVRGCIESAIKAMPAEIELVGLCKALDELTWWRLLKKASVQGRKLFPKNPHFLYFEAVAHYEDSSSLSPPVWKIEPLLEQSRRLARLLPPSDELRKLVVNLDEMQNAMAGEAPLSCVIDSFFRSF